MIVEVEMSDFVSGPVKWFDPVKGYGFVVYNNKDIFIHSKKLRESGIVVSSDQNCAVLNTGDTLRFKIIEGPKGLYATDITKA